MLVVSSATVPCPDANLTSDCELSANADATNGRDGALDGLCWLGPENEVQPGVTDALTQ